MSNLTIDSHVIYVNVNSDVIEVKEEYFSSITDVHDGVASHIGNAFIGRIIEGSANKYRMKLLGVNEIKDVIVPQIHMKEEIPIGTWYIVIGVVIDNIEKYYCQPAIWLI